MSNVTTPVRFADSPNIQAYADVLIRVQQAICAGDDEIAGRLCDETSDLADRLTVAEVRWTQRLSNDLESLCDEELLNPNPYPRAEYSLKLGQAWLRVEDNPENFLTLLRYEQDVLTPDRLAYVRARTYEILGFPSVHIAFMRRASQLAPDNSVYKIFLIEALRIQERHDELEEILDTVLADPQVEALVVVFAVGASFMLTRERTAGEIRPYFGRLRRKLQEIISQQHLHPLPTRVLALAFLTLGSIQDKLRRKSEARAAYQQAYNLDSNSQEIRVAYATSLLSYAPATAYSMFADLVANGTRYEAPYLIVAMTAGENGMYQECAKLSERLLDVAQHPKMRAYAYEFLGICEFQAIGFTSKVEEYFKLALSLAPDEITIRQNYDALEKASRTSGLIAIGNDLSQHRPDRIWHIDYTDVFIPSSFLTIYSQQSSRNLTSDFSQQGLVAAA